MSHRIQAFLLRNTTFLQRVVNDNLAKKSGMVGNLFRALEIGPRQYGFHVIPKFLRYSNFLMVRMYQFMSMNRPYMSRFLRDGYGHMPILQAISGITIYAMMFSWLGINEGKRFVWLYEQDCPRYWYEKYSHRFPTNLLHNRVSAHYLEIRKIFQIEMFKKYYVIRKQIILERESASQEERLTKYALNPNYVYQPMGEDDPRLVDIKLNGQF